MSEYKTEQEAFWAGDFGSQYISRNPTDCEIAARTALLSKILARTTGVGSIIELGANIGNNLKVIHRLFPDKELSAVEINADAVGRLQDWGKARIYHQSLFDFVPDYPRELAMVSGVLIHLNPEMLPMAYEKLDLSSNRYVGIIEYYNPSPVEVSYRGHSGKLFKRDFCGEMMEAYPQYRLVDYGFVYHRDPNFPLDDLTWFLLEK